MPVVEVKKSMFYKITKRGLDIIFSLTLFLIFLPIIAVVAILILFDSKWPIFADTPERVGKNGKPFKMYKFRSMVQNAHEILRENPKYSKLFDTYKKGSYKLKDDPRVTRVGHFIRKDSLKVVLSVRPGITGFWQVSGRSEINFDKRIQMDADYVRKRSVLYDLWIILKTPWAMISGKGAL